MPVNYCIYCGEKLIDGAKFCSNCGKPVYSSEDTSVINTATNGLEQEILVAVAPTSEEVTPTEAEPKIQMELCERTIEFDQCLIKYNDFRRIFGQNSDACIDDFVAYYQKNVKDFNSIYDKALPYFLTKVKDSINFGAKLLKKYGIMDVNDEQLIQLAISRIDLENTLKEYNDLAVQLVQFVEQLSSYRAQNRSGNQMRWQGGGFGLRGALSGALTAGILNLGTDALRGLGNAIVDASDRSKLKKIEAEIFKGNDHCRILKEKLYTCCEGVRETIEYTLQIYEQLKKPALNSKSATVMYTQAASIVENATPYTPKSDYDKVIDLICKGLAADPYQVAPYITLYRVPAVNKKEVLDFVKFFGVEFQYKTKVCDIEAEELTNYEKLPEQTLDEVTYKLKQGRNLQKMFTYTELKLGDLQEKKKRLQEEEKARKAEDEAKIASEQALEEIVNWPENSLEQMKAKYNALSVLYPIQSVKKEANRLNVKIKNLQVECQKQREKEDFFATLSQNLDAHIHAKKLFNNIFFRSMYNKIDFELDKTIELFAQELHFEEKYKVFYYHSFIRTYPEEKLATYISFATCKETEIPILYLSDGNSKQGMLLTNQRLYLRGTEPESKPYNFQLAEVISIKISKEFDKSANQSSFLSINNTPRFQVPTNIVKKLGDLRTIHLIEFFINYNLFVASIHGKENDQFASAVFKYAGASLESLQKGYIIQVDKKRPRTSSEKAQNIIEQLEIILYERRRDPGYYNVGSLHSVLDTSYVLLQRDLQVCKKVFQADCSSNEIFLFYYDNSIGGTFKESFLMTDQYFHCHSERYGSWKILYKNINRVTVEGTFWTYLAINGKRVPITESESNLKVFAQDFSEIFFPFLKGLYDQQSQKINLTETIQSSTTTDILETDSATMVQGAASKLGKDKGGESSALINLHERLKELCIQFLLEQDQEEFMISDALIIGLGIEANEIYLAQDDTLFKSGKNGFAITSSGIYCRDIMESKAVHTTFDELRSAKQIYRKSDYTYADKKILSYFSGKKSIKEDIRELFQAIWELLQ